MTKDIFVYIAGPYTRGDVAVNVRNAILMADQLSSFTVSTGQNHYKMIPYTPHLTHFWHMFFPHNINFWYEYDLKWLQKCDVLFRMEGESIGVDQEERFAKKNGLIVVHSIEELSKWAKECLIEK